MNKLTLILQDKSVIAELAKDESVKIRIADAIIDGIRKRSSKVTEGIAQRIAEELEANFYNKSAWRKTLSDEVKKKIQKEAKSVMSDLIEENVEIIRDEVSEELKKLRSSIKQTLETMDIEPFVEKYVKKAIKEKFNL